MSDLWYETVGPADRLNQGGYHLRLSVGELVSMVVSARRGDPLQGPYEAGRFSDAHEPLEESSSHPQMRPHVITSVLGPIGIRLSSWDLCLVEGNPGGDRRGLEPSIERG